MLVPLYEADGETRVVLIKRPETMSSHRGEIAFPGGKFEPGVDADLRATALREAHEEIGLSTRRRRDRRRASTASAPSASRFTITPFVGLPRPSRPVLDAEPARGRAHPRGPRSRSCSIPTCTARSAGTRDTADFDVHFYDLDDETVWGATARILTSFLAHLVAGR